MKHSGPVIDRVAGKSVIDCSKCKFKHIDPIPTEEELKKLYSEEFYSGKKPNYLKDCKDDFDWWKATYQNYFSLIDRHASGKKLLDIGSGPGYFIKVAKKLGYEVTGVEPSKDAASYSKKMGLRVINDSFNGELAKKIDNFDIITMNLVLEHVPDPAGFLKTVHGVLKKGGILFVMSPNDYNPWQKILSDHLGFKSWWVSPEQHLNYFDFESIKKLIERCGYKVVDQTATFPMEFFLLGGDNYVGKRALGRKCHQKRKNFEINLLKNQEAFNDFYRAMAGAGIGREFVIISKKR